MSLTAEQATLVRHYFYDLGEGSLIKDIIRLFGQFERDLETLTLPGNDQWHEGKEHIRLARQCFARSLVDAILTGELQ